MKKIKHIFATMIIMSAISLFSATTYADIANIDIDGVESWDGLDDVDNTILLVDLGLGNPATIDGIGWDLTLTTFGASYLSEAVISFGSSILPAQIDLTVGFDDFTPGSMSYSSGGIVNLFDNGIDDIVLPDGILYVQFYESFDDIDGEVDAFFEGMLTVSYTSDVVVEDVSAPSMLAVFAMGLFGAGFARVRKAA